MAETQAQSKLGELFVDLGVGGLGQTLKALNSVSASFLLTKNAATQAIKPIVDMSKQGGTLVTALDKINAVTGITAEKLQGIRNWSKLNNVSFESLVGSIESVQQALMDIRLGKGLNKGFQLLGIEAWQLDPNDPLKALDLIQSKLKQVNEVTGATALRELGMNQDLAYTFKQANKPLSQAVTDAEKLYNLSEEQIKSLQEQQKKWNEIDVATEKIKNNIASWSFSKDLLATVADMMTIIAEKGFIDGFQNIDSKYGNKIADAFNNSKPDKLIKNYIENSKRKATSIVNYKDNEGKELSNFEKNKIFLQVQENLKEEEKKYREKKAGKQTSNLAVNTPTASNNTVMGATPVNNDILPSLPNVEPSSYTTNNSSKSINYNPTINMKFEIMGDGTAEQAQQIQQAVISQQELTFSELLNMAGT